jgi:hypothetical protein
MRFTNRITRNFKRDSRKETHDHSIEKNERIKHSETAAQSIMLSNTQIHVILTVSTLC